jgi:hypothetical protein
MKRYLIIAVLAAAGLLSASSTCEAHPFHTTRHDRQAAFWAARQPWHGPYYNTQAGRPVALVVPPNANTQTKHGWGVGSTQVTPIYHQFGRSYDSSFGGAGGYPLYPTPAWPSHTDQFGIYYIRGPY